LISLDKFNVGGYYLLGAA